MGDEGRAPDGHTTAKALRAAALDLLRRAEAGRDARRFNRLVRSALDLLDRARGLSGHTSGNPRPFRSKEE